MSNKEKVVDYGNYKLAFGQNIGLTLKSIGVKKCLRLCGKKLCNTKKSSVISIMRKYINTKYPEDFKALKEFTKDKCWHCGEYNNNGTHLHDLCREELSN
jgi:hypothetical protein